MGHDLLEHRLAGRFVLLERGDQSGIEVVREQRAKPDPGIDRAAKQHRPAEHAKEPLIGRDAMLTEQRERLGHTWTVGQALQRIGGLRDDGKPLDRYGCGDASGGIAEEFAKLTGQAGLVIPVLPVTLAADLVEVEPAQFLGQIGIVGIEGDAAGAEQIHGPHDPVPAFRRHGRGDRNVVGQVPGLKGPDSGEAGLERCDPLGEGLGLEKQPFVLERIGPHPKGIDRDPPKAAKRRGGEGHMGRQAPGVGERHDQVAILPLTADLARQHPRRRDGDGQHAAGERLDQAVVHGGPRQDTERIRSRRSNTSQPTRPNASG